MWAKARKISNYEAAAELTKQYLNGSAPLLAANTASRGALRKENMVPNEDKEYERKPISQSYLRDLQLRLQNNADAMAYLRREKRGLDDNAIADFGLGLSNLIPPQAGSNVDYFVISA